MIVTYAMWTTYFGNPGLVLRTVVQEPVPEKSKFEEFMSPAFGKKGVGCTINKVHICTSYIHFCGIRP